ncbi:MAG: response regulator [Proteobacteria bacterium]|nr:response regulator [Pseudomonadota bacterium]MBU1711931.1 response regulator [Pseudomonadota bacterium]
MEYSILLVDDEEDFCQALGQRLERMGYIVYTATCGRDALTVFRDVNPMIVLMDVMLPDNNGLDLMKQMKTENPDTEVIIITGHGNMELAIKSFQYDATDFITKPIDREALEQALDLATKKMFDRRRLQKSAENKAMRDVVINELVNDDVLVIGADYRIIDINLPMLCKLGVTREEVIGRFCYEVTHHQNSPCSGKDHPCPLIQSFNTKKPFQTTHVHLDNQNREIYYSISCYPIFGNGQPTSAIEMFRDITHEINKQKNLLQQSKLASIGRLAAGVAHEINNPLTTILTTAMLSQEDIEPKNPMYKELEIIASETLRCRKIVVALLDFARQSKPLKKEYNLKELIEEIVLLTKKQAAFKDVRVESYCAADVGTVQIDKGQLQQAIINLILNGIESTDSGGEVSVIAKIDPDPGYVEIQIRDTGKGIPKEDLDKVFDPFYTTKESGTGLGLAITNGIIDQHGGVITVSTHVGQGSTFTIRLPFRQDGPNVC